MVDEDQMNSSPELDAMTKVADDALARIAKLEAANVGASAEFENERKGFKDRVVFLESESLRYANERQAALDKVKDLEDQVKTANSHITSYADAADTASDALVPLQTKLDVFL